MSCTLSSGYDPFTGKFQPEGIWKQFLRLWVCQTGLEEPFPRGNGVFFKQRGGILTRAVLPSLRGTAWDRSTSELLRAYPFGKAPSLPRGASSGLHHALAPHFLLRICKVYSYQLVRHRFVCFARGPRLGGHLAKKSLRLPAHCGVSARVGAPSPRGSAGAHARPPPQCATPRGRRESRRRHYPEASKGAEPPGRLRRSQLPRARARPPPRVPAAPGNVGQGADRPHVSPPAAAASAPIM